MDARDFLTLADQLAAGNTEAEWRSALSRTYYAVFHVARDLLSELGFLVPRADRAHSHVHLRLANCGNTQVQPAGAFLNNLRQLRNEADYNLLFRRFAKAEALAVLPVARQAIQTLDAAKQEPTRTQIRDAMRVYERDVLRDVTWRP